MRPGDAHVAAVDDGPACPYLRASGSYRYAHASREHVCEAAWPHSRVHSDKQTTLCLLARHGRCQTYLAAQGLPGRRAEAVAGERRPIVTTTPTIVLGPSPAALLEHRHVGLPAVTSEPAGHASAFLRPRRLYLYAVAVLIALAATLAFDGRVFEPILGAHRATPPASASVSASGASASTTPSSPASTASAPGSVAPTVVVATATPASSGSPSPTPTKAVETPTASASASATASARPSATPTVQRYSVKAGDTLTSIAHRFGTTAAALAAANHIDPLATLQIGQLLVIP